MTTFRVEAQVSSDEVLKAVGQLSPSDLERFVSDVVALQAQRKAPSVPYAEAELLLKINQGIPASARDRYQALIAKRQSEMLNAEEHGELLRLTDLVEQLEAKRVEYLAELARLRRTTLTALMQTLGTCAKIVC